MKKLLASTLLTFALLTLTAGPAFAQEVTPTPTTTSITGTVQSVALETDATGAVTGVLVTYTDSTGATQTATLTLADAITQGLVSTDAAGVTTVNDNVVGLPVTIPAPTTTEEGQHPVGLALANFFSQILGLNVDYKTIMDMHENGISVDGQDGGGFGFGVIAQALWMTKEMGGDTTMFQDILKAKATGEYSNFTITHEDGTTETINADNWGQFKKAILQGKKNNSLGDVMSNKQDPATSQTLLDPTLSDQNQVNNNDHGNSGNSNGNKNKGKGHGHGGHGHGKP